MVDRLVHDVYYDLYHIAKIFTVDMICDYMLSILSIDNGRVYEPTASSMGRALATLNLQESHRPIATCKGAVCLSEIFHRNRTE